MPNRFEASQEASRNTSPSCPIPPHLVPKPSWMKACTSRDIDLTHWKVAQGQVSAVLTHMKSQSTQVRPSRMLSDLSLMRFNPSWSCGIYVMLGKTLH